MILLSTDKQLLDASYIHAFLSQTYWAKGRTLEEVVKAIANSLNVGLYQDEKQIGYARIVTDYTGFAYIMDVFTDPQQRGNGYARQLMEYIFALPELQTIKTWRLATTDAHGLYARFGFQPLSKPENMMERILTPPH